MFDIALFFAGCLVVLGLFLLMVKSAVDWWKHRTMKRELDRRGVAYDPYDGLSLEMTYYRTLREEIDGALRG